MSKPLSPAAREVMDAYQSASDGCYVNGEWIQDHAGQIAAALRAVADQVVPEVAEPRYKPSGDSSIDVACVAVWLYFSANNSVRTKLLAIAAELERQS